MSTVNILSIYDENSRTTPCPHAKPLIHEVKFCRRSKVLMSMTMDFRWLPSRLQNMYMHLHFIYIYIIYIYIFFGKNMCPISKTQKNIEQYPGNVFWARVRLQVSKREQFWIVEPCGYGQHLAEFIVQHATWACGILLGTRFGVPRKCCYACQRSANAIGVLSASNIFRSVVSRTQNLWGKDWQPWATERMCPKLSSLEWRIWWLPFFFHNQNTHKSADTCLRYRWDSYLIAGASCKLSQLQASNQLIHHHFLLSENHPGM